MCVQGGVWVGQTVFDVEVWTNRVLPSEINQRGLVYHCLVDYDLEFVQVCIVCVLMEITNTKNTRLNDTQLCCICFGV